MWECIVPTSDGGLTRREAASWLGLGIGSTILGSGSEASLRDEAPDDAGLFDVRQDVSTDDLPR